MAGLMYCYDENKLLTERELEVLASLSKGLTNPEIAEELYITVSTVKAHMSSIFHKMGAENRVDVLLMLAGVRIIPKEEVRNQIIAFKDNLAFPLVK